MRTVRPTLVAVSIATVVAAASAAVTPPRQVQAATTQLVTDPASLVNTLVGTTGGGNVFPGADVPFGMLQWSPDTSPDRPDGGGYEYNDSMLRGFSLTHISGPGCSAFGDIPILPMTGTLPAGDPSSHTEAFTHAGEAGSAGYYTVQSGSPSITTELTSTLHSAMGRFTYPATTSADVLIKLIDSEAGSSASSATIIGNNEVQGSTTSGHFCGASDVYTVYFDITFDHPFTSSLIVPGAPSTGSVPGAGVPGPGSVFLTFDTSTDQVLQAKVGISFVSAANAKLNVQTDNPGWDFDTVRSDAHAAWNDVLGRIQVGGGTDSEQQLLYTSLYHSLLHPNVFSDVNGQYMGFDGAVHTVAPPQHDQYANYSGWDIYHSQVQLASLLAPAQMSDAVQSMLNDAAQDNGMLPKWALANAETYIMVGDPADGIISGSYAFGARGFDTATALADMLHEANVPSNIRPALSQYLADGYIPDDGTYGCCNFYGPVATQLEYDEADAAIAQFATALGDTADAAQLTDRAQNWKNVFNPANDLQNPKLANGQFFAAMTPTSGEGMVEGTAAQYRWVVPFNHRSLVAAMGGDQVVNPMLDSFFSGPLDGSDPNRAFLVNEFELGVQDFYDYTGEPWGTQLAVNRLRTELFHDAPLFIDNNDDLGAESSLLAWSMLGVYPDVPGSAVLDINGPEFPLEVVHLSSGQTLTINAPGASTTDFYIQGMNVNGVADDRTWLDPSLLTTGGTVDFAMGSTPNTAWGAAPQDAPPSYGTGSVAAIGYATTTVVPPGGAAVTTPFGAQSTWDSPQTISWSADPATGVTVTPSSGSYSVGALGRAGPQLTVTGGQATGTYPVTIHLSSSTGVAIPDVVVTVAVANPGDVWPWFDSTGISDTGLEHPGDANQTGTNRAADLDGNGYSYSAQALAASLLTPGGTVSSDGVTYTWPSVSTGQPDNIVAAGQTIPLPQRSGQAELGVLGASTDNPSGLSGQAIVTYTDGSQQDVVLGLSDWTLGGGSQQSGYGNTAVATMPYRNRLVVQGCITYPVCGAIISADQTTTYVFSDVVAIDPTRTVEAITLPPATGAGQMHVFAVATSASAPPANVPDAPWAPLLPVTGLAASGWIHRRRHAAAGRGQRSRTPAGP